MRSRLVEKEIWSCTECPHFIEFYDEKWPELSENRCEELGIAYPSFDRGNESDILSNWFENLCPLKELIEKKKENNKWL